MIQRKRGRPPKIETEVDLSIEAVDMIQQDPRMYRPIWIGVIPGGGKYAEMECREGKWSTIIRGKGMGAYRNHESKEKAIEYLSLFFGRRVTAKD